jgi:1,4-alpha-glucan branching enzyme
MVIRKSKSEVIFVLRLAQLVKNVHIVGTFNGWDEEHGRMMKGSNGAWRKWVNLPPGRYEYKFIVDGEWQADPDANEVVRNTFGSENSVLQQA